MFNFSCLQNPRRQRDCSTTTVAKTYGESPHAGCDTSDQPKKCSNRFVQLKAANQGTEQSPRSPRGEAASLREKAEQESALPHGDSYKSYIVFCNREL